MALLPPFMLDTVAAIGNRKPDGSIAWSASGFLYGELAATEGDTKSYSVFLVTNRHVLAEAAAVTLRFGSDSSVLAPAHDLPLVDDGGDPLYALHPDSDIDVAVLPVDVAILKVPGTKFSLFVSDQHVMERSEAIAAELTEGDGAFVLGFPMGQVGGDRNYVIVRHGALARIRDWLAGASKEFLVDATVFPGNSGGPVISRPTSTSITGTKRQSRAMLLGMVKGYVPYTDTAVSAQTGRARITFEENTGLSAVVPFDFIREVVRILIGSNVTAPQVETPTPISEAIGPEVHPAHSQQTS